MSRNITLTYNDLITLSEDDESIPSVCRVRGVAFKSGIIAKAGVLVPEKELANVTRSLEGSPFLVGHSHDPRDVIGKIGEAWRDNEFVRFKGTINDQEIAEKVRLGLLNSVSVGLHVDSFTDVEVDGQQLKKLSGITVKELSVVVFPAVEGAQFEPTFEFSVIEADDPVEDKLVEPVEDKLTEADIERMQVFLASRGRVVLSKEDYEAITDQLNNIKTDYDKTIKMLYLYSNCSEQFIEEIISLVEEFSIDQLEFLWRTYKDMVNNIEAQAIIHDEDDNISSMDSAKEDLRQLIFGTRRSGKWNKNLKSIRDIEI